MTTLPPERASSAPLESHQARQIAESFGVDADRYDRTRPRYPQDLVDRIVATGPGRSVLDVGTGTGIVARQLRDAGCAVLGVEADARMAEYARRTGIDVEVATFEAWDPVGRLFDAVVAGQAWHWVDPVAGAAKAAQVLRPGGRFAAFWNAGDPPPALADATAAVHRRMMPAAAGYPSPPASDRNAADNRGSRSVADAYSAILLKAKEGLRTAGGFDEVEEWRFDWEHSYTKDEWLDQVPTSGLLTRLPSAQLEEVLAEIGAAVDAVGGGFTMRYSTIVITATRQRNA